MTAHIRREVTTMSTLTLTLLLVIDVAIWTWNFAYWLVA
jgi:hypothetical protein